MHSGRSSCSFLEQMRRIHSATSTRSQIELARFLGIRQTYVSDANRRGRVPVEWLALLRSRLNIRPEWILGGEGSMYLEAPAGQGSD